MNDKFMFLTLKQWLIMILISIYTVIHKTQMLVANFNDANYIVNFMITSMILFFIIRLTNENQ